MQILLYKAALWQYLYTECVFYTLSRITVTVCTNNHFCYLQFYFVYTPVLKGEIEISQIYIIIFLSLSLLCSIAGLFLSVYSVRGLHHATLLHAGRHHRQHHHVLLPHSGPQRLPFKRNAAYQASRLAGESFCLFFWSVCRECPSSAIFVHWTASQMQAAESWK